MEKTSRDGARSSRMKMAIAGVATVAALTIGQAAWSASKIAPLQFRNDGDASVLTIAADGPFEIVRQEKVEADKQFVIDLKGAELSKGAGDRLNTSSYPGKVRMISAYPVEGEPDTVRVLLQLSDASADVQAVQDGNKLNVSIPIGAAAATPASAAAAQASPAAETQLDPPPVAAADATLPPPPTEEPAGAAADVATAAAGDSLGQFVDSRSSRHFIGSPITLQVRDVDVVDVLRLIGEASGFNIVADGINGKITLSLVDVPWDQALDVVLTTKQLGAERNNNILRIVPLQQIQSEKQAELAAKSATEANAPKVTRIFPISYADLSQIKTVIDPFLSKSSTASGSASVSSDAQPLVQADSRTNSLIVRDLPSVLERVKKLIEILDTQTPQILIEGKIVEASSKFTKSLGGQLAVKSAIFGGASMGTTTDPLFGTEGDTALTGATGGVTFGVNFSNLLGLDRIKALLAIEETEGKTKVISSPRVVVANGKSATITSSLPVAVPKVITSSTGSGGAGLEIQNADLNLTVTPTAANDGFVKLVVNMTKGTPEDAGQDQLGVANKTITTEVFVESGSTLSIGGVYSADTSNTNQGIPFLRRIPVLGWLFGSETARDNRSELFIFISPRILNEKESVSNADSV